MGLEIRGDIANLRQELLIDAPLADGVEPGLFADPPAATRIATAMSTPFAIRGRRF